ncbi:MAG TPA: hypothetical protein VGE26_06805 [Sphingobacteriaceae bacterium]
MKSQTISFVHNGRRHTASVQLVSPLAWIFVVNLNASEPFHLEYDEEHSEWAVIDEDAEIEGEIAAAMGEVLFERYRETIKPSIENASSDCFIMENGNEEIICFWDRGLRIRVIPFIDDQPSDRSGELVYYGNNFGKPLTFQTIDYQGENPELVRAAIEWYAEKLNYPQMVISKRNPFAETQAIVLPD